MSDLEDLREDIFLHYIVENKKLREVMDIMKQDYNAGFSVKQYKTKMGQWGYFKNIKRQVAVAILREKSEREKIGKGSIFYANGRPIELQKIERYCQRNRIQVEKQPLLSGLHSSRNNQIVCKTPPPERPLELTLQLRIPERLLYELDHFMRALFESGAWKTVNDRSQRGSKLRQKEIQNMINFTHAVHGACLAANSRDHKTAFEGWKRAFVEIESLLKGTHGHTIPHIIFTLNKVIRWGFKDVALMMIGHIAQLSAEFGKCGYQISSISMHIHGASTECIVGLERQVYTMLLALHGHYLGPNCSEIEYIKGQKDQEQFYLSLLEGFDRYEPLLDALGHQNELSPGYPLKLLRIRLDIIRVRAQIRLVTGEMPRLIQRAGQLNERTAKLNFHVTWNHYNAGLAQYYLGNFEGAKQHFAHALYLEGAYQEPSSDKSLSAHRVVVQQDMLVMEISFVETSNSTSR